MRFGRAARTYHARPAPALASRSPAPINTAALELARSNRHKSWARRWLRERGKFA